MIRFEGVSKTYGRAGVRGGSGVRALVDVSVGIPGGAAWGIVGPNGAGKTTFFALLLGFLHPTAGEVELFGDEPRAYVRRHGAAYLPERFRLPPEWTVRTALAALARLEGLRGPAAAARVDAVIQRFGLEDQVAKTIGALSHGLLQRLGLAQAALGERALVVLDEPTEGLDPLWRIRFRAFVQELRREGRTILIASHDLGEVERLTERALLLEDGHVREILDVDARGEATTYRLELAAEAPSLADIFPGAAPLPQDGPAPGQNVAAGERRVYTVSAADPAELSRRLAALIELGGVVVSVTPATEALETRVRRALKGQP